MAIYALGDLVPQIDPTAFVHPDATVIGSDAIVTTSKSVVLGRASVYASGLPTGDKTIIGAAGDSGAAAVLQINGASQHIGLASAPTGTAVARETYPASRRRSQLGSRNRAGMSRADPARVRPQHSARR